MLILCSLVIVSSPITTSCSVRKRVEASRHSMVIVTRPRDANDPFFRPASTEYSQAYTSILKAARGGASSSTGIGISPVLILVATDIDALCAARSLTALFGEDDIAHRLCPVDGYATLNRIVEEDVVGNLGVSV